MERLQLESQYKDLLGSKELINCSEIYNLIFMLNELGYKGYIYLLAKKFIVSYCVEVDGSQYGYDEINEDKVNSILDLFHGKEKYNLVIYFIKIISNKGNTNVTWLEKLKHTLIFESLKDEKSLKGYLTFIFRLILSDFKHVVLTIFAVVLVLFIVFLPAPFNFLEVFELTLENYNSNHLINTLYNAISVLLDIENECSITPINNFGVILLFLGKIVYISLIVGCIGQKVNEKIQNINDES